MFSSYRHLASGCAVSSRRRLATEEMLLISCSGCELRIDYSEASFRDLILDAGLQQAGLSTEAYSECVTICLAPAGNCLIQAVPKLRPNCQSN
jgi:hypothetical protein